MNPVEIEEAVAALAEAPFEAETFPFDLLKAFGNKETTIKRLRSGATNKSDLPGAVLQRNNIHIATCARGEVDKTLAALRESPMTARHKTKLILATDGEWLEAEDRRTGDPLACAWRALADHFGFFLPLAGITTVKEITDNPIDIKATAKLNKLYVALLKANPDWTGDERRSDFNRFMARLIFCFFAEDTGIFSRDNLFTETVEQMTAGHGGADETRAVIAHLFEAMASAPNKRKARGIKRWAAAFPYVNGGLFERACLEEAPRFSRIARSYLLSAGALDWKAINPDIFGSMIQAVADEDERGSLGLHYTSVPNIFRVLNPLFLDDLRAQLEAAGDSPRKLLNLRKRLKRIRIFDPACGSGNFLVIAYKKMRAIEHEIVKLRREKGTAAERSWIGLSQFYGIEIKSFPAEIARLALIIAEFQCNVLYRGLREAVFEVLPLDQTGNIACGNALKLDWLEFCPPAGEAGEDSEHASLVERDLAGPTGRLDLEGAGRKGEDPIETYVCGNPPYLGSTWQTTKQKAELEAIFKGRTKNWKSLDYVAGWFMKAADYGAATGAKSAFVATNSICQGQQVPILWPLIFATGREISFAHTSFKWDNLASHKAGVTVVVVGLAGDAGNRRRLFSLDENDETVARDVTNINAYLVLGDNVIVGKVAKPLCKIAQMDFGNKPVDGGHLLLTASEVEGLGLSPGQSHTIIRPIYGSKEFIQGLLRYCLWVRDADLEEALAIPSVRRRIEAVREMRLASPKEATNEAAIDPHRFGEVRQRGDEIAIVIPAITSENRDYLPCGLLSSGSIVSNKCFALYDAPLWNMALIASRLHWVWIATVCVRLRTDFSYSNTLGWNTFPVRALTANQKAELTASAEDILIARERHFPATIKKLYKRGQMPDDLRRAHERNDEIIECIYIGRRFRNDTERLEKLFEMYMDIVARAREAKKGRKRPRSKANKPGADASPAR